MSKKILSFKALGAATLLGLSSMAVSAPAQAQSLSSVLDAIRRDSSQMSQEDQQRLREFQQKRDQQAAELQRARTELNASEARGRDLAAQFDANEAQLSELATQLETEAGDFGELLGQFRQAAEETRPVIDDSLSSFNYPGRTEALSRVATARTLPTRQDLDSLPKAILQEMVAQSEVKTFKAEVANAGDGDTNAEMDLLRIGVFTAATMDGAKFVNVKEVDTPTGKKKLLTMYKKQPTGAFKSGMAKLISAARNGSATEVIRAPIDPQRGKLLETFGLTQKSLNDRIADGGPIGKIIIALLIIGLLLAFYKIFSLFTMGGAMRRTAKTKKAGTGNPLARVFDTYENHRSQDIETLELKLDEQILRESPRIERFNDIIKVLAAVAPLLGLLGTVIGMIQTFTSITIYGTGDPRTMAGGISTALMTTVMGLVAAIPLLLLHAVSSSMARGNQQILDEQAAGLVADKAEGGVA